MSKILFIIVNTTNRLVLDSLRVRVAGFVYAKLNLILAYSFSWVKFYLCEHLAELVSTPRSDAEP